MLFQTSANKCVRNDHVSPYHYVGNQHNSQCIWSLKMLEKEPSLLHVQHRRLLVFNNQIESHCKAKAILSADLFPTD